MTVQLIRAQYVLGHDGTDHVLHRDAVVVHSGGVVRYVGTEWPEPVDDVIDLGPALLMPGLIDLDAVADIDHALLDSWSPDSIRSGYQWSEEYARHRRRAVFDADDRATIREYALTHLLLNGITTCMPIAAETHSDWAETHDDMVRVAAIAQRLGIRSYLGPSYRSGVTVVRADGHRDVAWEPTLGEDGLAGAVDFLDHVAALGDDRLRGVLLPCRIETMTPQLLAATAAAADDRGVLVRLHAMQGALEHELLGQRLGYGPLELLERSGLLHERLLVPHATFPAGPVAGVPAEAAVRRRLGAAGVTVVHCPLTAARYGMALRSFDRFREDGVNLALGTDSAPPDLIRAIDIGSNLAKILDGRLDAGAIPDYLRAATLGGARALGRPDLGRIAVGAQADLTAVSLRDNRLGVTDDPVRTMVMNGSGRDVVLTVVAGRVVMRDGLVPGVDLDALRARAQELFVRMRAAYPDRDHLGRGEDELFPPSFARV